jgi:poly(A) polymerase
LKEKILRAIGDPNQRFEEDHLRLLRAVRFAARFALTIEPSTAAAIKVHAHQLKLISPERIADELRLILAKPEDTLAWHAIRVEFPQIAEVIFRFADSTPAQCPIPAAPNIVDALPTLENPFGVWMAAMSLEWRMWREEPRDLRELLSAANIRRMVRALRQSLRISNDEADVMHNSLEGVAILVRPAPLPVAVAKRFLARPTAMWSRHLLIALKCQVGAAVVDEIQAMLDRTAQTDFAPPPLITGDELISHGLKPGPMFKRILHDVYDAQLEARISTKEQAQEMALKLAREAEGGH